MRRRAGNRPGTRAPGGDSASGRGRGWRGGQKREGTAWRPAVDISERSDAYRVTVEIPGIKAGGVEITMADGLLTIQGERHAAREAAGEKMHRSERGYGVFRRSLALPSSKVNADRTEASVRDGGTAGWDASRPRRLRVDGPSGSRVVRLGWFATMPARLLTAISASDERTDLVTIPPHTSEQDARAAMEQAAQAGNRDHAPAILAAIPAPASPAAGRAPVPATGEGSS